jgi:hypothetical protein
MEGEMKTSIGMGAVCAVLMMGWCACSTANGQTSADAGVIVFARPAAKTPPGAPVAEMSLCDSCGSNRSACDAAMRSACSAPPPHCRWFGGQLLTVDEAATMDAKCQSCAKCPR